jgi:cell division protein FtsI (penicillin-binding protein 3)
MHRLRQAMSRRTTRKVERPAAPAAFAWRTTMRRRLAVAAAMLGLWAVGIEARLVYLQVIDRADLVERAKRQQLNTRKLPAKRGDILDRRGHVLATSVDADSIVAVPSEITDHAGTVARLCAVFRDCTARERQELIERLKNGRSFAYIRRQVSDEHAAKIKALALDGIGSLKESRRFFPNGSLAAHILGYVGLDNRGLGGVEAAYDREIRGKDGQAMVSADARRHAFSRKEKAPTTGSSIELTIDEYLQHIAERELRAGVVENRALGGSIVIMNPRTGEILAMANEPTFDPNNYRDSNELQRRNRAVQDLYEPGSTFKIVTASASIEEKAMPIDAMIDASGGRISIGSRVVTDTHDYGVLSFTDVLVKSSNVGAIKIGFKLGTERLSDYVQKFGFGRPISPDFPSESPGIVWDRAKWTESALASVSMGYQIGVTPLQMAAAFSAVANRGEYIEPRVVRGVYRDGRRYEVAPKTLRRVSTEKTAAALTTIMEQVVERGTATMAQIPGYTIAGKTGTANKLVNGRYSSDTYASFAGFVPSVNPVATILVVLDSPRGKNGHFGGPVSAPIFRRVAEATLRYQGVAPTVNPASPVLVARDDAAESVALPIVDEGAMPPVPDTPGTVPDLRGMSAREAMRKLMKVGMAARLSGDGFVVSQDPAPGEPLVEGAECRVVLARSGRQGAVGQP